jgi:hypothetical protein
MIYARIIVAVLFKLFWISTRHLHGLFLSLLIPAFHLSGCQLVVLYYITVPMLHSLTADLYFLLPTAMRVCVYACLRLSTACIIEVDLLGICPVSGALHRVGSWGVLLARAGPTALELSEGVWCAVLSCSSSIASLVVVVILMSSAAVVRASNKQQPTDLWRCMLVCIIGLVYNHSLTGFADNDAGEYLVMRYFT